MTSVVTDAFMIFHLFSYKVKCVMCVFVCKCGHRGEIYSLYCLSSMYSRDLPVHFFFRPLELAKNSKSAVKHSI